MADYKKYKVGITVKEPWADNISYEQLDMTLFAVENGGDGCAYVALKPNIGVRPNQDPTTWIKATQRGQSIYDYCIEYGLFVGTEEEFAQDYADAVQAAKDAAASATHVEEDVSAAEQGRVSAENARVSAESQRASAEESRVSSEAQRSVNETGRVNAEDSRVAAENGRVVAESQRVSDESTRATNEENRRAEFGGMMRDAETAIELVDTATTEAENVDATVDGMIVTITDRHGVSKSVNVGFNIYRTYGSVAAMNADAANVEDGKFVMIATLDPTSTENAQLWVRNSNSATSQNPFTFISDLDQASSAAWADWMENQKPIIEADHATAQSDHTTAVSDHTNATNDHAIAGQDHTTAGTDHTQAVSDSTRAGQDHSVAEQDHTRAEGDHTTASTDHSTSQSDHTTASSDHTIASGDHTTALSDHDISSGDHTTAGTDHTRAESDHAAVEVYVDSLGAFDISAYHATGGVLAEYADLNAALGTNGANIPDALRKGGMSVKFVQSSDHKYVQYRLKAKSFSTYIGDWEPYNNTETRNQSFSDLDIADELGNILARFHNGHVKTKNFDSSINASEENRGLMSSEDKTKLNHIESGAEVNEVSVNNQQISDLDISDEQGNVLAMFKNGHIKTKNFDSARINNAFSISLSGLYNRTDPFGVFPNLVYKDAAKRMLPSNVIPLIIIAGQSNADGRAHYNTADNWDSTRWLVQNEYSLPNYMMWNNSSNEFLTYNVLTNNGAGTDEGGDGSGVNRYAFDPFFAKKFIETYGTPLYAVREAMGGTSIGSYTYRAGHNQTWNPRIGYIEKEYGVTNVNYLLLDLIDKINRIKEWCSYNHKVLFPIAILWHQGESDATQTLLPSFKDNTSQLISFMRGIFEAPALPFINGFIQNDYNQDYAAVNQIFLELNQIDSYMKTVDMAGHYTSIGDGMHYDGQALAYMGEKMFDYYYMLNNLI